MWFSSDIHSSYCVTNLQSAFRHSSRNISGYPSPAFCHLPLSGLHCHQCCPDEGLMKLWTLWKPLLCSFSTVWGRCSSCGPSLQAVAIQAPSPPALVKAEGGLETCFPIGVTAWKGTEDGTCSARVPQLLKRWGLRAPRAPAAACEFPVCFSRDIGPYLRSERLSATRYTSGVFICFTLLSGRIKSYEWHAYSATALYGCGLRRFNSTKDITKVKLEGRARKMEVVWPAGVMHTQSLAPCRLRKEDRELKASPAVKRDPVSQNKNNHLCRHSLEVGEAIRPLSCHL